MDREMIEKIVKAGIIAGHREWRKNAADFDFPQSKYQTQAILSALNEAGCVVVPAWNSNMDEAPSNGEPFLAFWPHIKNDGGWWSDCQSNTWRKPDGSFTSDSLVDAVYAPEGWQPTHWKHHAEPPAMLTAAQGDGTDG